MAKKAGISRDASKNREAAPEVSLSPARVLAEITKRKNARKLFVEYSNVYDTTEPFGPDNIGAYPWQVEFHNAGADHAERCLIAANRCISPWTKIETRVGSVPVSEFLYEKDFDVLSWDGESQCDARASGVFLKGIEPAFRILLDNGEFLIVPVGTGY